MIFLSNIADRFERISFLKDGKIVEATSNPSPPSLWVRTLSVVHIKYISVVHIKYIVLLLLALIAVYVFLPNPSEPLKTACEIRLGQTGTPNGEAFINKAAGSTSSYTCSGLAASREVDIKLSGKFLIIGGSHWRYGLHILLSACEGESEYKLMEEIQSADAPAQAIVTMEKLAKSMTSENGDCKVTLQYSGLQTNEGGRPFGDVLLQQWRNVSAISGSTLSITLAK